VCRLVLGELWYNGTFTGNRYLYNVYNCSAVPQMNAYNFVLPFPLLFVLCKNKLLTIVPVPVTYPVPTLLQLVRVIILYSSCKCIDTIVIQKIVWHNIIIIILLQFVQIWRVCIPVHGYNFGGIHTVVYTELLEACRRITRTGDIWNYLRFFDNLCLQLLIFWLNVRENFTLSPETKTRESWALPISARVQYG